MGRTRRQTAGKGGAHAAELEAFEANADGGQVFAESLFARPKGLTRGAVQPAEDLRLPSALYRAQNVSSGGNGHPSGEGAEEGKRKAEGALRRGFCSLPFDDAGGEGIAKSRKGEGAKTEEGNR